MTDIVDLFKKHFLKVVYVVIAIFMIKYTFSYFGSFNMWGSKSFIAITFALIALVIITMIVIIKFNNKDICKQFAIIALIWGLAFTIINPPFLVPDEVAHSHRAYDLAKGNIFLKAHDDALMLPKGLDDYYNKVFNIEKTGVGSYVNIIKTPLQKEKKVQYYDTATGGYNTIAYIPQSIGIFIGNALNLPIYFVLVLGRITNLMTWIGLCYLALKFIPIKKEFLFLLMCIPVGMQQAASLSPDALLNSASFLLIAYILYLKFEKDKVEVKDSVILLLLTCIIGSIKLPYILIAGVLILIPNRKYKFKIYSKILLIFIIAIINLSIMIGWGKISKPKVVDRPSVTETVEMLEEESKDSGIGSAVKKVISEPTVFLEKVGDTLEVAEDFYKRSYTAYMGWFKVLPPDAFVTTILVVLLLFAVKGDENEYSLSIFDRIIFGLMSCGMYLILCMVVLQWSNGPISNLTIFDGIQGRYFYPFIIGLYLLVQNTKLRVNINKFWSNYCRNLYISWTLAFSLIMIFASYFILP